MSSASAAPYVKDALYAGFAARPNLSAVKVLREWPRNPADVVSDGGAREAIWIGREGEQDVTSSSDVKVLAAGKLQLDETFTVWSTVQVLRSEGSMETASERAHALAFEMLAYVAGDPGMGIEAAHSEVAFFYADGTQIEERTRHLDKSGSATEVQLGVRCRARIIAAT